MKPTKTKHNEILPKDFIKVGVVGKAFGLKGYFFVVQRSQIIPKDYEELLIGDDPFCAIKVKILDSKVHNQKPVLLCSHCNSKEDVAKILGQTIWVSRQKLNPDELFLHDLCHKEVMDIDGIIMGKIVNIYNFGATDILKIINDKNECIEIPLIEQYIQINTLQQNYVKLNVKKNLFEDFWYKDKHNK